MSRDGLLPPGCTEADVDRACPGYDEEPEEEMVKCDGCGQEVAFGDAEWYRVKRWNLPFCLSCAKRGIPFLLPEYEP